MNEANDRDPHNNNSYGTLVDRPYLEVKLPVLDVHDFSSSLCVRFFAQDTLGSALEHAFADTVRVQPRLFPYDTVVVNLVLTP